MLATQFLTTSLRAETNDGKLLAVDQTGVGKNKARVKGVWAEGGRVKFLPGQRPLLLDTFSRGVEVVKRKPLILELPIGGWADIKLRPVLGKPYKVGIVRQ